MAHTHDHKCGAAGQNGKRLLWVTMFNFLITVIQVAGGLLSNSLSLLSDALHNLGDSSAMFIAFLAGKISGKQPDERKTFGYRRIEILAALFNSVVLMAVCIYLFIEAIRRFVNPEPVEGRVMFIVAIFGLGVNLVSILVLHRDRNHNLNVKAAYLHLTGDTLSSVVVIAGACAIRLFRVYWIDPAVTVFVGGFILYHAWRVAKETVDILMQAAPPGMNVNRIKTVVESVPEIDNMHHLHVWKLDDTHINLEAHINLRNNITVEEMMAVRLRAEDLLHDTFGIEHVTLQMGYRCCGGNKNLIAAGSSDLY